MSNWFIIVGRILFFANLFFLIHWATTGDWAMGLLTAAAMACCYNSLHEEIFYGSRDTLDDN